MALVGALQLTTAFDPAGLSLRLALPRVAPRASCLVLRRPSSSSGTRMQDNNAEGTIPGTWCLTATVEEKVHPRVVALGILLRAFVLARAAFLARKSERKGDPLCLIRGLMLCRRAPHTSSR